MSAMRFSRAVQLAGWFKLFAMVALALGGMMSTYVLMGGSEDNAGRDAVVLFVVGLVAAGVAAFMAAVLEVLVGIYETSEAREA